MACLVDLVAIDPDASVLGELCSERPLLDHTREEQPLVDALAVFGHWRLLLPKLVLEGCELREG